MALGAQESTVVRLIVREAMLLAAVGVGARRDLARCACRDR